MDKGFYVGMVQAADRADACFGHCFNCLEEGHRWRDCKKMPLLLELQDILDWEAFNRKGGTRGKGGLPSRPNPSSKTEIRRNSLLLLES